jgi:hypothetical protein
MVSMSMFNPHYVLIHPSQSQYQYDFSGSLPASFEEQEDDLCVVLDHLLHGSLEAERRKSERATSRMHKMAARLSKLEADFATERARVIRLECELLRERLQAVYHL